jgi:uncharacterized membrane protein YsdA (DUF1294 family)/cold shock CspA family protein
MRIQGKIIKWNDDKGFGFIAPNNGGRDIFVHRKSFLKCLRQPVVGEVVTFEIVSTLEGKTWAGNVLFQGQGDPGKNAMIIDVISIIVAFIFFTVISGLVFLDLLPILFLAIYSFVSLVTFFVYRIDKLSAECNDWRTSEVRLHLLSLFGGWPGALVAQRILHHKSKKQSFRAVFRITVILNLGFLVIFLRFT